MHFYVKIMQILVVALFIFPISQVFGRNCNNERVICCPNSRGVKICKTRIENITCCPGAEKPFYNPKTTLCSKFETFERRDFPEYVQCGYNKVISRGTPCEPEKSKNLVNLLAEICKFKVSLCCYDAREEWICQKHRKNLRCCQGASNPFYTVGTQMCNYSQVINYRSDMVQEDNKVVLRGKASQNQENNVVPIHSYFFRPTQKKQKRSCRYEAELLIPNVSTNNVLIPKILLIIKKPTKCNLSLSKWYSVTSKTLLKANSSRLRVKKNDVRKVPKRFTSKLDRYWESFSS